MYTTLEGKVAIVTGAGGGLGRAEAIMLAQQGAMVVVNDFAETGDIDGVSGPLTSAQLVAREIADLGGTATYDTNDVSQFEGARQLVSAAVDRFGGLDIVVNNAGIVRDRMFVSMSEEEWDAVIRVHLKGTFSVSRHAASYWRAQSKAERIVDARIINTTSGVGLYGNLGQANYAAAKAGIASLTRCLALELENYGVTTSGIAPMALTPMTAGLRERGPEELRAMDPANVAALVTWLAGPESRTANGLIFNVKGGYISVADGWRAGAGVERGEAHSLSELSQVMPHLIDKAQPPADILGKLRGARDE